MSRVTQMPMRRLGSTGVPVSEVGLGTWQLGGKDWGAVSDADALAILHRAAELGVNFFDTADVYGAGRSEQLIGRFLREFSAPVWVATKLGRRHDGENGWPGNFTRAAVRRHTQESLARLGVERLFLTQWHCIPTDVMRDGEVFEHLRALQREGLIEHWGVSVESVEEGLLCLEQPGCASLQVIFNIFRQKVARALLPVAAAKGVGIIARVPLASGLLAGKFTAAHRFDERDHRHYNADGQAFNVGETFAGLPFAAGVQCAQQVRALLPADQPMAIQALRWILDHPAVSTVIPGATRLAQVDANCAAAGLSPLSDAVHQQLAQLYDQQIAPLIRGAY